MSAPRPTAVIAAVVTTLAIGTALALWTLGAFADTPTWRLVLGGAFAACGITASFVNIGKEERFHSLIGNPAGPAVFVTALIAAIAWSVPV